MVNTIKVLFWLHLSKMNSKNRAPIILRLSYQGKRIDRSTGYYVVPEKWSKSKQLIRGDNVLDAEFNAWISTVKVAVKNQERKFIESNYVHLQTIMDSLFLKVIDEMTLFELINEHNEELKARIGKDYTYSTYEKYVFTEKKVKSFIN